MAEVEYIRIKGARVHNLKNISIDIPVHELTVITGLSGSGKSSLAFDTLFAEGQRRYVESLSAYARQFLGRMVKPDVDLIEGIAPAIAIEQKTNTRNPRSTVGTVTEIYDYLKLLFAKIGKTYSPVSGKEVKRDRVKDVQKHISEMPVGAKLYLLSPYIVRQDREVAVQMQVWQQQGFSRVFYKNEVIRIDDFIANPANNISVAEAETDVYLFIDRLIWNPDDDMQSQRLGGSIETAFSEGESRCFLYHEQEDKMQSFSELFEQDGIQFEEPSVNFFSFNSPYGACKKCEGFGSVLGIDEDLVVPNKSLSVFDGAIACWKGEKMGKWLDKFIASASEFDFPIHKPWKDLSENQRKLVWVGNRYFKGLDKFFQMLEENTYKIQYRVMLARYKSKIICPDCRGTRLRKDTSYVKVSKHSISDMLLMPVSDLQDLFNTLKITKYDREIAKHILEEIESRLSFLVDTGLSYLTLNRLSNTLSGGETQRINLARALGSSLVGSMYVLDEPSIGLHPVDTDRLIAVLKKLRDLGNSLIIVEHDEDIIGAADYIIDLGPDAGRNGGELVFQGPFKELKKAKNSHTADFLNGIDILEANTSPRKARYFVGLRGVAQHNLKDIDVDIPLGLFTAVTGVSGSGKSTLVKHVLYPALRRRYGHYTEQTGKFKELSGDLHLLSGVEMVDQNPIGRSSRSNPATYVKAFDDIRELFSLQPVAKQRAYKPGYFSFNVEGGRCEVCQGEGSITVEMQFMADVHLLCDECKGSRYKEEVLDVKFHEKNIRDILEMTIAQALEFFKEHFTSDKVGRLCKRIADKLQPLYDVGLGYLQMGQPSNTLSGGEAQRIKLAFFLARGSQEEKLLFIFDEPTSGLHYYDIRYFKMAVDGLISAGHSVLIVEHNMELIKCADWIIDLGPEGGEKGGEIMYQGPLIGLKKLTKSATAPVLMKKFES
ncbi:MAG: excinuclease ABC subunit UvrA [Bacteroidales bacterium]|nr:excinuclease ABC subunit UvrA [Bacteroidales bacterium]